MFVWCVQLTQVFSRKGLAGSRDQCRSEGLAAACEECLGLPVMWGKSHENLWNLREFGVEKVEVKVQTCQVDKLEKMAQ